MRMPSFRSIEKFFVQSRHGFLGLSIGDSIDVSRWDPVTIRRHYLTGLIGSRDQVERHARKLGLENLPEIDRNKMAEGLKSSEIKNSNTELKTTEIRKSRKL